MEQSLLKEAQGGSRSALDALIGDSYHQVYTYCRHMCGDVNLAQDLTQETFARAIANLDRFRGDASFTTWTIGIAINVYRDMIKKKKLVSISELDGLIAEPLYASGIQGSGLDPEAQVIQRAFRSDLSEVLGTLPETQRRAFVLKHLLGLDYRQIAAASDCPIGTIRSRLNSAIKRISKQLEAKGWP